MTLLVLKFTSVFLATRAQAPKLHRVIVVCIAVWESLIILIPFVNYAFITKPIVILQLFSIMIMLATGVRT